MTGTTIERRITGARNEAKRMLVSAGQLVAAMNANPKAALATASVYQLADLADSLTDLAAADDALRAVHRILQQQVEANRCRGIPDDQHGKCEHGAETEVESCAFCQGMCPHDNTRVLAAFEGTMDDHDLYYLACNACGAFVARTVWKGSRATEERPMTADELARVPRVDGPLFGNVVDDVDAGWD